jgi:ATP-dependent protease HslVU (ClpYQ) ATPase subunit
LNTDDKNAFIPVDHVAFKTVPNEETIKLYQMENYQFDKNELKTNVKNVQDENMDTQAFASFLEDLMNASSMLDERPPSKRKSSKKAKRKSKNNYLPPDMTDENELDRHMIMMQMYIPAEAIMNLITSGIIKPQVLLDMVDEIKKRNRFTGDEKTREDFGDKFSDWNPDPNSDDYK